MIDEKLVAMMTQVLGVQRVGAMIADAAPDGAHGEDSTKSVSVDLVKNGDLGTVLIIGEWKSRLRNRSLGGAVTEAIKAAYAERTAAMSSKQSTFVPPTVTREEALAAFQEAEAKAKASTVGPSTENPVDLAERLLARDKIAPEAVAKGEPVKVTFASGAISGVVIDESWASAQTATRLASAIMNAARKGAAGDAADPLAGMFQAAIAAIQQANR